MEFILLLAIAIGVYCIHARVIDIFHRVYRRQIDYAIMGGNSISEMSKDSKRSLGYLVREMQKRGFEPHGSPIVDHSGRWFQAMVKYESYFGSEDKHNTLKQKALARQVLADIRTDDGIITKTKTNEQKETNR